MWDINFVLGCSIILFSIGLFTIATQRNLIKIIIGVEIMMNGGIMAFVIMATMGTYYTTLPMAFAIILISLGGSTVAVALAIITITYRYYGTLDIRELKRLKW